MLSIVKLCIKKKFQRLLVYCIFNQFKFFTCKQRVLATLHDTLFSRERKKRCQKLYRPTLKIFPVFRRVLKLKTEYKIS